MATFGSREKPLLPEMSELKTATNAVRDLLDSKHIGVWHQLTSFTNLTGDVVYNLKRQLKPELCTVAWAKMYEICHRFRLLEGSRRVRTAHVCEAPGGFIAATNHYLRQLYGDRLEWDWVGLTLNPYFEDNDNEAMVDDDQFILDTIEHWCFGDDDSGNIMSSANIRALWARVGLGKVDLVTGDGSINCQSNPNEQELTVAHLHYCEAVFALGALRRGGAAVLKMFTLFENQSIELLYLMSVYFDKLSIFKPATSKGGNAEVYLVARGFRGIGDAQLQTLLRHVDPQPPALGMDPNPPALFDVGALPVAFLDKMKACAKQFSGYFCDVIRRNLDLDEHGKSSLEDRVIRDEKANVAKEFIRRYDIRSIPAAHRIVATKLITTQALNTGHLVSASHGRQSWTNKSRAGATLADRQRNHAQHREDWALNHSTATSSLATRTASPPPYGLTSAGAGVAAPGAGVDPGPEGHSVTRPSALDENPAKRSRREPEASQSGETSQTTASPHGAASSHPRAELSAESAVLGARAEALAHATAAEDGGSGPNLPASRLALSFAERMMAKMGHVTGQGLGAQQQGISAPLEPVGNMERIGLGFADHKFATGLEDAPFYFGDFDDMLALSPADRTCDPVAEAWPITVAYALQSVSLSKFCRHQIKQGLTTQRRTELPVVLQQLSSGAISRASVCVEFPSVALQSALSTRFPHDRVCDAVSLALIDERCALRLRERGSTLVVLDFHGSQSGFAAYLRERCCDPAAAKAASTVPAVCLATIQLVDRTPAPCLVDEDHVEGGQQDTATASAPATTSSAGGASVLRHAMTTSADVDACLAQSSRAVTLAIVDGSVEAATEVAGLGNAHVERWRKHTLLAQVRAALATLTVGDSVLIVKLGDTFTRFTASLLYVIGLVFTHVAMVKPFSSAPWTCDRFLVARGFLGVSPPLTQHLASVHARLDEAVSHQPEHDVLSFVPIPRLLSPAFFRFLCRTSERYAQRETNAVALLLGLSTRPEPSPAAVAEAESAALSQVSFLAPSIGETDVSAGALATI